MLIFIELNVLGMSWVCIQQSILFRIIGVTILRCVLVLFSGSLFILGVILCDGSGSHFILCEGSVPPLVSGILLGYFL